MSSATWTEDFCATPLREAAAFAIGRWTNPAHESIGTLRFYVLQKTVIKLLSRGGFFKLMNYASSFCCFCSGGKVLYNFLRRFRKLEHLLVC
jgi:hypothetical protein